MKHTILLIIFFIVAESAYSQLPVVRKQLKSNWVFSDSTKQEWLNAEVPGTVQTDLYRHKKIPDPLAGNNEKELQWISENDWTYKTEFEISSSEYRKKHIEIIFEGIDTYAKIFINGTQVLHPENMFRSWSVDAKKYLKSGKNEIKVVLLSITKEALKLKSRLPYSLPANDEKKLSVYTRKAAYHYGWDFGPSYLTMGIWKPVYIHAWNEERIVNFVVRTVSANDSIAEMLAIVDVEFDAEVYYSRGGGPGGFSIGLGIPGISVSAPVGGKSKENFRQARIEVGGVKREVVLKDGVNSFSIPFQIKNPDLWWPNGIGDPALSNFCARLITDKKPVDTMQVKTGIRTVELVQQEDKLGKGFYFRINGLPVFMKGANYIPQSNFLTSVTESDYRKLIQDVRSANMNMLRVWGGGIYENDIFYKLCDENGIMVWQDFMFACGMYPSDSEFLGNVEKEVEENIKRLRIHPSIVMWCGNNEINVAWKNWGWQKQYNYSYADSVKIYDGYHRIFEERIPVRLSELDPLTPYISSSPISNWGKRENFNSGNMHYWGVWHGEESIDSLSVNVPRFMTEYGMQSYSSIQSLQEKIPADSINMNSKFILNRQKSYKGNSLLKKYADDYYGLINDIENFVYCSQLNQAEAMTIAIESHRKNAGFCMGSLYWQLNDTWPGASWSTREYNGQWKAAHYRVRDLYDETIIICESKNDTLKIFLETDNPYGVGGNLILELKDFKGNIVYKKEMEVSVTYLNVKELLSISHNQLLGNKSENEVYLNAQLTNNNEKLCEKTFYFVKPKLLKLEKPEIKSNVIPSDTLVKITLNSATLAKNVFLQFEKSTGNFSDNYFDLLPGEEKIIEFIPAEMNEKKLELKYYLPQ